jgi:glycosyltransferase involved in cell wall biosynthesis
MNARAAAAKNRAKPERLWPAIVQIGPDPADVGGMQTVVRTYVRLLAPVASVEVAASWRARARLAGVFMAASTTVKLAAIRLRRRGERRLVHVHLSHRGSFLREGALAVLATVIGHRVVATVHGSNFVESSRTLPWSAIYRTVLRRLKGVAVLNSRALEAVGQVAPRTRAIVVPNPGPVPPDWTPNTTAQAARPVVVFAGEVCLRKGVDVLLRAWRDVERDVPGARLVIAGPAGDVVVDNGPTVRVLGPISSEDVRDLLGRARVAVLPSRGEGMPMFVLEAMAAGRPIVGTPVGAMQEMIAGGGIVVPVGDAGGLADALRSYLADAGLADRHGNVARERYLTSHCSSATLAKLSQFYELDPPC